MLNIITIEDQKGIDNLDAILDVPGIDVAAIASFDLSMSLGIPGQFNHPTLKAAVCEAEEKIRRSGVALAGVALDSDAARLKRDTGYRMLLVAFDVDLIERAAHDAVQSAVALTDVSQPNLL
jgi:4-hydroxy-2-oxoheptanedioate aldolase